jgi:hypothetical protein
MKTLELFNIAKEQEIIDMRLVHAILGGPNPDIDKINPELKNVSQPALRLRINKALTQAKFFILNGKKGTLPNSIQKNIKLVNYDHSSADSFLDPVNELDLPFSCVYFEHGDNIEPGILSLLIPPSNLKIAIAALICETSPKNYDMFYLFVDRDMTSPKLFYQKSSDPKSDVFMKSLSESIQKIHGCKDVANRTTFKQIWLSGKKNKGPNLVINQIIYINSKNSNNVQFGQAKVVWSHRFEVRGHWRKIDDASIGKNRAGEYNKLGFTWVNEHEKGPKELPLVEKVRVAA